MTIADDLAKIASIGPFFDVTKHEKSSAVLTPWHPMSELITLPQHPAGEVLLPGPVVFQREQLVDVGAGVDHRLVADRDAAAGGVDVAQPGGCRGLEMIGFGGCRPDRDRNGNRGRGGR